MYTYDSFNEFNSSGSRYALTTRYVDTDPGDETLIDLQTTGGSGNNPPTITQSTSSNDIFGWIKARLNDVNSMARDIGTTVGTVRRATTGTGGAVDQYRIAQQNAYTQNSIGQWFQYAPTGEKVIVALALAGLAIAAYQAAKD